MVATMLRRRRLSIVAKNNFSCGKVKNVYKTKIVVIIMAAKTWVELIKRVDAMNAPQLIPPKSQLSVYLHEVISTMEKIYRDMDRMSDTMLHILAKGFKIHGLASYLIDSAQMIEGSADPAKVLRSEFKTFLGECIRLSKEFLSFAEGGKELPPGLKTMLSVYLEMIKNPEMMGLLVQNGFAITQPPLEPHRSIQEIKETPKSTDAAIKAVRDARVLADTAIKTVSQKSVNDMSPEERNNRLLEGLKKKELNDARNSKLNEEKQAKKAENIAKQKVNEENSKKNKEAKEIAMAKETALAQTKVVALALSQKRNNKQVAEKDALSQAQVEMTKHPPQNQNKPLPKTSTAKTNCQTAASVVKAGKKGRT